MMPPNNLLLQTAQDSLKPWLTHFFSIIVELESEAEYQTISKIMLYLYEKAQAVSDRWMLVNLKQETEEDILVISMRLAFCSSAAASQYMQSLANFSVSFVDANVSGTVEVVDFENIQTRQDLTEEEERIAKKLDTAIQADF